MGRNGETSSTGLVPVGTEESTDPLSTCPYRRERGTGSETKGGLHPTVVES